MRSIARGQFVCGMARRSISRSRVTNWFNPTTARPTSSTSYLGALNKTGETESTNSFIRHLYQRLNHRCGEVKACRAKSDWSKEIRANSFIVTCRLNHFCGTIAEPTTSVTNEVQIRFFAQGILLRQSKLPKLEVLYTAFREVNDPSE